MPISPKSYPVLKNKVSALSVSKRTRFCRRMCERLFDLSWYVRKPKLFLDSIDSSVIALRYLRKMNYERKIIINLILLKRKKNNWTLLERITNRKRYLLFIYICDERQNTFFLKRVTSHLQIFIFKKVFKSKMAFLRERKKQQNFFIVKTFLFYFFQRCHQFYCRALCRNDDLWSKLEEEEKSFFFFLKNESSFFAKVNRVRYVSELVRQKYFENIKSKLSFQ